MSRCGAGWSVKLDRAVATCSQHLVDRTDVAAGVSWIRILLVTGRKYIAVDSEQLVTVVVAERLQHLCAELIGPGHDDFADHLLDLVDADTRSFARRRPHDRVQACERRIRNLHAGVDRNALERFLEDGLDAATHCGRIFFARHEHNAGEKAPECVAAQEETHSLTILQVQYTHRGSCEIRD